MNVNPVARVLASSIVCSGSSAVPTSWYSQGLAFFPVVLLALVAFPASVSAAPPTLPPGAHIVLDGIRRRQDSSSQANTDNSSTSISMNVWLPILAVTVVFMLFSFVTCARRCARADAAATSTTTNQSSTPANGNTTRPRRRPRRTPSQISTKSLPPYMKEPGDQELVLFRGPESETEDDPAPPHAMPSLAEDEDEDGEMRGATFGVALARAESVDTMAHHAVPQGHRRGGDALSLDSVGSEAGLLHGHQRVISVDNDIDPRGEAPAYTEAVSAEGGMSTISLNDPEANNVSFNGIVPPSLAADKGRSRFNFLMHNPFSSPGNTSDTPSTRSESPALHMRSGSALSRFSTRESHEGHSRTPSRNNNLSGSHSRSNSNLLRAFRSHSPGMNAGASTISLDSISAPLTHTVTRAEFHAPKGGLLTPEQIKLITSREGLERFGVPYGADAVAAFSLSREKLAEMGPPPEFESVTGAGSASEQRSDGDVAAPRSASPSPPSISHRADERGSSGMSAELDWAQIVQRYGSEEVDEPGTARPMTPRTARP